MRNLNFLEFGKAEVHSSTDFFQMEFLYFQAKNI